MLRTLLFALCVSWLNYLLVASVDPIGLRVLASLRGLLLGTQADVNSLRNNIDGGNYTSTIKKNYQLIVPGFELKAQHLWWGDNIYNFTDPDWLIGATPSSTGWIQQNGMQLRGHNLLWAGDSHIPKWLLEQEASITPDKAKSLMSDYIHTVVSRYRGKIPWWDVVNEAIDDVANNTHPFNLRNSFWFRKLGPDFMKYAFIFAHEADPDAKLYYNDYRIEQAGVKSNRTLELATWLRSQGATIHGIGLQWHVPVSINVTPGDDYYQSAQHFVDQGFDFMVTELDISIPMKGGKPVDPADVEKQGRLYRSILNYVLHFAPKSPAMLTWGFTDRYSWIPSFWNYTRGDALPLDYAYQPKPAYWQMEEELTRVLSDGVFRLSPQSQLDKCLGSSTGTASSAVQLYSDGCNHANEKWNVTWLGDGTYRLSPMDADDRALAAYNTTAKVGDVQTSKWSADNSEEWVLTYRGLKVFRVAPRNCWMRVLSVFGTTNIGIVDENSTSADQKWILTSV